MMELECNDDFDQIVFDPEDFWIVQSMDLDFDPSTFLDDIDLDDQSVAVAVADLSVFDGKKKKTIDDAETVLTVTIAPPLPSTMLKNPNPNQDTPRPPPKPDLDWNDEHKMESSTLKLRQSYQHNQSDRRKNQTLPPPKLPKPQAAMQNKAKALPSLSKGKSSEILLRSLSPLASSAQNPNPNKETPLSSSMINPPKETHKPDVDWNDAEKMESSKRKLHQGYQLDPRKRRKIQILEVKDLPLPKPKCRMRKLSTVISRSRKCQVI